MLDSPFDISEAEGDDKESVLHESESGWVLFIGSLVILVYGGDGGHLLSSLGGG